MSRFLRQSLAVARRDLALQRSYGASALLGVLSGALGLVAYFFIGKLVAADRAAGLAGGSYFAFVWTGLAVQLVVAAALGALAGALAREAAEGTLEPALSLGASPLALLQVGVYAGVAAALFDLDLGRARLLPAALALLATVAACAPIGFAGAAAWLTLRRAGAITTGALFAFGIVGGIYFPVGLLPAPVATAAAWVPLTAGLDAVRGALLEGGGLADVAPQLGRLGVVAAVALPASLALLRASLRRAERRGTLALV